MAKLHVLGFCDILQRNLPVDVLYDVDLVGRLVDEGLDYDVLGTLYVVLLYVFGYEADVFLAEFAGLALAYALAVLELVKSDGVVYGHVFQGRVRENHEARQLQLSGHVLAQVLEH